MNPIDVPLLMAFVSRDSDEVYFNSKCSAVLNGQTYSIKDHALARSSVTYTFGFVKKIQRDNEDSQYSGINSGILK